MRWLGLGAVTAAVAAVVLFWFQPQKLLIDETVDDELPATEAAPASPTAAEPAELAELASGTFVSLDHSTSGRVRVLRLADGTRIVRLEGLRTDNGPDLYLYLSRAPVDGAESSFDDDIVNLGRLKGNQGDQNYELASDVDLEPYTSVVIWCDRFNSAFGAAALVPA